MSRSLPARWPRWRDPPPVAQAIPPRSFLPDSPNIPRDRHQYRHEAICPGDRRKKPGLQREIRISAATVQATDDSAPAIADHLEAGCSSGNARCLRTAPRRCHPEETRTGATSRNRERSTRTAGIPLGLASSMSLARHDHGHRRIGRSPDLGFPTHEERKSCRFALSRGGKHDERGNAC